MQCRQLADIALNAPPLSGVFYCLNWVNLPIKLGFPRARTDPTYTIGGS